MQKNRRLSGKALTEEGQNFVAGCYGWLARLVNQMGRYHAVGARYVLGEEWRYIQIGSPIWQYVPRKTVAKGCGVA